MNRKLIFIGIIVLALVLTTGTFAYTYTSDAQALNVTLADDAWTTYQTSPNQPDWGSVLPEDGCGSDILVPTAAGEYITIESQYPDSGEHWDKVDDQPADDYATYISTEGSNSWQGDLYELADLPDDVETITSVTFFVRYAAGGNYNVRAMAEFKTNDQLFSGPTEETDSTDFVTISWQNDFNPSTGEAWTADEINALQVGVAMKGNKSNKPALCTQVYVRVDYESAGVSQGELPDGDLYEINPHPDYTGDLLIKIYLTNTAELLKAYQYINMEIYVSNSVEAGSTPNYKILSIENGVVEFNIIGGSASSYTVHMIGGSYRLISGTPDSWGSGWSITPEFYCEVTQR